MILGYLAKKVERGTNSNVIISSEEESDKDNYITMPKELFQEGEPEY